MMTKRMETDQEFAKAMAAAGDEDRRLAMARREGRTPPTAVHELVEYFLNTQADDMEVRLVGESFPGCRRGFELMHVRR